MHKISIFFTDVRENITEEMLSEAFRQFVAVLSFNTGQMVLVDDVSLYIDEMEKVEKEDGNS